jgi:hypothetical protein
MAIQHCPAREVLDLDAACSDAHHCVPRRDALARNGPHIGGQLRPQNELGFSEL